MVAEAEAQEQSEVQSCQDLGVRMPFKSAKMEVKPARNTVRTLFYKAKNTEEYPWNKTPIMVTHLHAKHTYVIPRKTKKNKSKELVGWCPALRLQRTLPRQPKEVSTRVDSSKLLKVPK